MPESTEIPTKPACCDQRGRLTCDCMAGTLSTRLSCISARAFWLDVDAVLRAPTPEARKAIVAAGGRRPGDAQRLLWRAARQEMAATMEAAA